MEAFAERVITEYGTPAHPDRHQAPWLRAELQDLMDRMEEPHRTVYVLAEALYDYHRQGGADRDPTRLSNGGSCPRRGILNGPTVRVAPTCAGGWSSRAARFPRLAFGAQTSSRPSRRRA
jgi:hypothetical protein